MSKAPKPGWLLIGLFVVAGCADPEPLVIGDNPNTSGNSFWHGVSKKFDQRELQALYDELNGPGFRAKLQQDTCPDSPNIHHHRRSDARRGISGARRTPADDATPLQRRRPHREPRRI